MPKPILRSINIIILATLCVLKCSSTLLLSSITVDDDTISTVTDYSFQIARTGTTSPIPAGSTLEILFPGQYSQFVIDTCQPLFWAGTSTISCQFAASKLTVTGGFPSDFNQMQFSLKVLNLKNPFPAKDYLFSIKIRYSGSTIEDGDNQASLTISPSPTQCSLSLEGSVFEEGKVTITYTSSFINIGDPNYRLFISMNNYYPSDPTEKDINADITNINRQFLGSYLFSTSVASQIIIKMVMPPSTAPQTNFVYVLSENIQGQKVDYCFLDVSGVTPNSFTSLTMTHKQVQTSTDVNIVFLSNSPLLPSDKLKINFDGTQFNIKQVQLQAIFYQGITGQRVIDRTGNQLQIAGFVLLASFNVQYGFTLKNIVMPPSNKLQYITFTLQTENDGIRNKQILEYSALPGPISNSVLSCLTYQIGSQTTCSFSFTFVSEIPGDGYIKIRFPTGFEILPSSFSCEASGNNIKPKPTCRGYSSDNSIRISEITLSALIIEEGTHITITLNKINIPNHPDNYQIILEANTVDDDLIDSGNVVMTSVKRALTTMSIAPTNDKTNTQATYELQFTLNLNLGLLYKLQIYFPFENIATPSANNNQLPSSYDSQTKTLIIQKISNNLISVAGFKTHESTAPVTLSGQISYNNKIYYYFDAYDVTVNTPKQITTFAFSQSDKTVNQKFIGTFVISDLKQNDVLQFDPNYYSISQDDCSVNCQCQPNGRVLVKIVADVLTEVKVNFNNPQYITKLESTLEVLTNSGIYKKQTKDFTIEASITNQLFITASQNKPYLGELSTYEFDVHLSTQFPSSSQSNALTVNFPKQAYTKIQSYSCTLGCTTQDPTQNTTQNSFLDIDTIYFFITSINVKVRVTVINPSDKTSFSTPILIKSSSFGDMDSGYYTAQYPCNDFCRQCLATDKSHCLNCYNSLIWPYDRLDNNQCVSQCPTGKYLKSSTSTCQTCSQKCLTCTQSADKCFFPCKQPNYFLNHQCLGQCSTGYYESSNFKCIECEANCVECTSATVCIKCSTNTFLHEQSCRGSCPTGTYTDVLVNECKQCPQNCLSCDSQNCNSCQTGYFRANGQCLENCPQGLYQNNGVCQVCQEPCSKCEVESTKCLSCVKQYNGIKLYYFQNKCEESCPLYYYESPVDNVCIKCSLPCKQCTSTSCLNCMGGYKFSDGLCLQNCPDGKYLDSNTDQCVKCVSPCALCSSDTICLSCIQNRYLLQQKCENDCPLLYFKNNDVNTCDKCESPCLTCTQSSTNCLSCSSDIFFENRCLPSCPQGFYSVEQTSLDFPDKQIKLCKQCSSPCKSCITLSTRCHSCIDGYTLYNEACSSNCPSFYYNNNGICQKCSSPCLQCNITGCITCELPTHYFEEQQCGQKCINLHPNNKSMKCQQCRQPCRTCTWSDTCLSCVDQYIFHQGECITICPAGFYELNNKCIECPQFCVACSVINDQIRCTDCENNTLMYGYVCLETCPVGHKSQSQFCVSSECKSIANCLTCSALRCISCQTNYTLNNATQQCDLVESETKNITSVVQLPVPFPFLIAMVVVICLAFLIRIEFSKMFVVIFIYSFCGIIEVGGFGLWIALLYTKGVLNSEQSLVATEGQEFYLKIAVTALCGIYVLFNFIGFILYCAVTRADRKYVVWQMQDNRCSAVAVTTVALMFSFRFNLIKFSKLAHKQAFSAPLASDSKLSHMTILAYLSIVFISLPAIGLAGYMTYLQTSMNYLFFTSIEVAVIGVIMIILSILQALIPKKYILEKKDDYKQGFAEQRMEGESLEEVLAVDIGREEYFYRKEIISQEGQVRGGNDETGINYDEYEYERGDQSSDKFGKFTKNRMHPVSRQLPINDQREQLDDILEQAQKLAFKINNQPTKAFGKIKKQIINDLPGYSSDSQSIGSPEEDDQPPPIDSPRPTRKKYAKNIGINSNDDHAGMDFSQIDRQIEAGLQYNKKKDGMNKLKQLFKQIQQQEFEQRGLRERLQKLNEKEKKLKQQEYERARELVERNQMGIEDQLSRINRMFSQRKQREIQRKKKLKQLEEQRRAFRQQRTEQVRQETPSKSRMKSNPDETVELDDQQIMKNVKKIKVSQKKSSDNIFIDKQIKEVDEESIDIRTNGAEDDDEDWLGKQEEINFLPEENWQISPDIQQETKQPLHDISKQQVDPDGNVQENVEIIHWPIDPELQEKINQVQQRANYYIKKKKQKSIVEQIDQDLISEETPYEIVYNDRQISQGESQEEEQSRSIEPILLEQKNIKIPKGRVNRNIIDLSPQR